MIAEPGRLSLANSGMTLKGAINGFAAIASLFFRKPKKAIR